MIIWLFFFFFTMAQQPPVGQGLLIAEDSRSYTDTPHSVEFWTSDNSASKYVILLGVLCSRIVPYFSILVLKWRWFVSISSWYKFCTSCKKYEIGFRTEDSVVLRTVLYWGQCCTEGSVVLRTVLYWGQCCTEESVVLRTVLYWGQCCIEDSVVLRTVLYWGQCCILPEIIRAGLRQLSPACPHRLDFWSERFGFNPGITLAYFVMWILLDVTF